MHDAAAGYVLDFQTYTIAFPNKASLHQKEALFLMQRSLVFKAAESLSVSSAFAVPESIPPHTLPATFPLPFLQLPVGLKCGVSHALYTQKSSAKYYNLLNFTNINIRAMRPHFILNKKTVILQSDYWGYT